MCTLRACELQFIPSLFSTPTQMKRLDYERLQINLSKLRGQCATMAVAPCLAGKLVLLQWYSKRREKPFSRTVTVPLSRKLTNVCEWLVSLTISHAIANCECERVHTSDAFRVLARLPSGGAAPLGLSGAPLDHNGMQLCTTWVQSKIINGYGQICCSCVSKGCTTGTRWSCVLLWSL